MYGRGGYGGRGGSTGYDTALICINGHIVNSRFVSRPEHNQDFCSQCGAKTIAACPACSKSIRGHYHNPRVAYTVTEAPKYCHACGRPYPWTSTAIASAHALAEEISELDENERVLLKASIDDLLADSPKAEVAVLRFKKLIAKAGKPAADALGRVLAGIITEAAKQGIWGR